MKEPSLFLTRTRDFLRRGLEQIEAAAKLDIEAIEKTIKMIEAESKQ